MHPARASAFRACSKLGESFAPTQSTLGNRKSTSRRAPQPGHQPHRTHVIETAKNKIPAPDAEMSPPQPYGPESLTGRMAQPVEKHDERHKPTPAGRNPSHAPRRHRSQAKQHSANHDESQSAIRVMRTPGSETNPSARRRMVTVGLYTARKPVEASSTMCSANATHSANHALPKPDAESAGGACHHRIALSPQFSTTAGQLAIGNPLSSLHE